MAAATTQKPAPSPSTETETSLAQSAAQEQAALKATSWTQQLASREEYSDQNLGGGGANSSGASTAAEPNPPGYGR